MPSLFITYSLILFILGLNQGFSWDPEGHLLVGQLAYNQLTPHTKERVTELAQRCQWHGVAYNAVNLGCWLDDIRGTPYDLPAWHYITWAVNPEVALTHISSEPWNQVLQAPSPNGVEGIQRAIAVLQGGKDPSIDSPEHALAILMHLVGDVHQPLHAASYYWTAEQKVQSPTLLGENDKGGNAILVNNAPHHTNFHALWDRAYRTSWNSQTHSVEFDPAVGEEKPHATTSLPSLASDFPLRQEPVALEDKPYVALSWARESYQLAVSQAYTLPLIVNQYGVYVHLHDQYVRQLRKLGRERIALAAARLAALLNQLLP